MWTRAARELSTLLLFSNIAGDQAVCVDVVLHELWNDEDDANRDKAKMDARGRAITFGDDAHQEHQ
ncbi:hypothetical protein KU74_07635 [Pectobacterium brasiliense]|uniref:Uncharacterized protein n=1 Tax=Pectobacterium brasiliense TaxID=180957 RepID=A0A0M2F5N1_9GAMM|nr:hypothetical protein [Pectobacterium brasiliense]KGA36323.1 hypothetical protein KU74_07635 [Pectobacterium brasiliense]